MSSQRQKSPFRRGEFWRGLLRIAVDGDCSDPLKKKRMIRYADEHGASDLLRSHPALEETLSQIVGAARRVFEASTLELEDVLWVIGCTKESDDSPLSEAHLNSALQRTRAVAELAVDAFALCDGDRSVLRAALALDNDPGKQLRTMTDSMWRDVAFDALEYAELVLERQALAAHPDPPKRVRSEVGRQALKDALKRTSNS